MSSSGRRWRWRGGTPDGTRERACIAWGRAAKRQAWQLAADAMPQMQCCCYTHDKAAIFPGYLAAVCTPPGSPPAKPEFSDRKPYPGCTAVAPVMLATCSTQAGIVGSGHIQRGKTGSG